MANAIDDSDAFSDKAAMEGCVSIWQCLWNSGQVQSRLFVDMQHRQVTDIFHPQIRQYLDRPP